MPYGKRTYRRRPTTTRRAPATRSRRYRRRKSRAPTKVHRPLSNQGGFPKTLTTKLVYNDDYSFYSDGTQISVQQINLASIYDPDVSTGGHQPYYRDQLANLYTSYKVVSCRVELVAGQYVPATTTGANATLPAQLLLRATNYSGVPGNFDLESERPGSYIFDIQPGRPFSFKRTFSVPYTLGVKKSTYLVDTDYWTSMNADPSFPVPVGGYASPYLNICVFNPYVSAGTVYVNVRMKLTYLVQFNGLILQGQS